MKRLSSLVCHLFSHTLESTVDKMGFSTVAESAALPPPLKESLLLLLIVRENSRSPHHQIVGFYEKKGEYYSQAYVIEKSEAPLPSADEASMNSDPWVIPEGTVLAPRDQSKTHFFRNDCLWTQHTLLEKCMSYLIQEIPGDPKKVLFHSVHGDIQYKVHYEKKRYATSVKRWIQEQKQK